MVYKKKQSKQQNLITPTLSSALSLGCGLNKAPSSSSSNSLFASSNNSCVSYSSRNSTTTATKNKIQLIFKVI